MVNLQMKELDELIRACSGNESVLLFGSQARGDANAKSDIDVLKIVSHPAPPVRQGRIQVSQYTLAQLVRLAREGSLFLYHLKLEGKILRDPDRKFEFVFEKLEPPNLDDIHKEVLGLHKLLHVSKSLYNTQPFALNRLCSFVLRTIVYASTFPTPCFSSSRLESVIGRKRAAQLVELKRSKDPRWDTYNRLKGFICLLLECEEKETYSTEDDLLERIHLSSPLVALSLSRILGRGGSSYEWTGE